jgi:hypothetical protein
MKHLVHDAPSPNRALENCPTDPILKTSLRYLVQNQMFPRLYGTGPKEAWRMNFLILVVGKLYLFLIGKEKTVETALEGEPLALLRFLAGYSRVMP